MHPPFSFLQVTKYINHSNSRRLYPMRYDFRRSSNIIKRLRLDGVGALEHIINLLQVVGARSDGGRVSSRLEVLLQVGLLAQVAHLGWC